MTSPPHLDGTAAGAVYGAAERSRPAEHSTESPASSSELQPPVQRASTHAGTPQKTTGGEELMCLCSCQTAISGTLEPELAQYRPSDLDWRKDLLGPSGLGSAGLHCSLRVAIGRG